MGGGRRGFADAHKQYWDTGRGAAFAKSYDVPGPSSVLCMIARIKLDKRCVA